MVFFFVLLKIQKSWTSDHGSLLRLDFFNLEDGLDVSLNAAGQSLLTLQASQRGLIGVQIICPNPTKSGLMATHSSFGSHCCKATLVSSGDVVFCLVPGRDTQPSRLQMRCTCVSTHMPWTSFHAICRIRWAILGPIPGRDSRSSKELGMSPSYFTRQILAIFFI